MLDISSVQAGRTSVVRRRDLLRGLVATTAVAAVGGPLLSGCSSSGASQATGGQANTVQLPEHVPFEGAKPQFPSSQPGAPAGFTEFPVDPVTTVKTPPLKGGTVTAMTNIFDPLPTPRSKNAVWQEMDKQLGGQLDLTIVPASDYPTKFQTMLASRKFPDICLVDSSVIDNLPAFMDATCADLTPHLSGAAVKDYPNLAAIPPVIWETCIVADKIYMLPIPRGLTGGSGFYNQTLLEKVGVDYPESSEDFLAAAKELSRPQDGHWAIVNSKGNTFFTFVQHMLGVPYNWQLEDGRLVKDFETDAYRAALEFAIELVKAKVIVPGSDGIDGQARKNVFKSGKGAFVYDGLPAYPDYFKGMKGQDVRPLLPMGPGGKPAVTRFDNIAFGNVVLKKADEGRIKELLNLLNFLAAPFGSAEYQLINFGVEGTDFNIDDNGMPVVTDRGTRELTVPWKYLVGPEQVIFDPDEEYVESYHHAAGEMIKTAVKDPVSNLTSSTNDNKGSDLAQTISDLRNDIIAGRKKLSEWDPAVKKWAEKGGDAIRGEYEEALSGGATPR